MTRLYLVPDGEPTPEAKAPPLRRVVHRYQMPNYTRDTLDCGHAVSDYDNRRPKRRRCPKCSEGADMATEKKPTGRFCYWIDPCSLVDGQGYRVSVVEENVPGHSPTGTVPFEGKPGQTAPWYWGPTLSEAQQQCVDANARLGLSEKEADLIVASSMFSNRPWRGSR